MRSGKPRFPEFRCELAHVRRRDWSVRMAADLMRRVSWFQPLMSLACRQLRRESEHACDDVVLGTGVATETYAGHLLQIARAVRSDDIWAAAVPMARRSTLERRIAAMLNKARNRRALSARSLVASTLILAAATFSAAAFRAEQERSPRLEGTIPGDVRGPEAHVLARRGLESRLLPGQRVVHAQFVGARRDGPRDDVLEAEDGDPFAVERDV